MINNPPKILQTDNGCEFVNNILSNYLEQINVEHVKSIIRPKKFKYI